MLPATLFEKQVKGFLMGQGGDAPEDDTPEYDTPEDGAPGQQGRDGDVAKMYPEVLRLAAESERISVVEMRPVRMELAFRERPGVWGARVRFAIEHDGEIPATERALFARLGLKAKKNGHGSLAVEAVTTGGFVHSWGVGKGMEVAQVGGDLTSVTIIMDTPFARPMWPSSLLWAVAHSAKNPCPGGVAFAQVQSSGMVSLLLSINFSAETAVKNVSARFRATLDNSPPNQTDGDEGGAVDPVKAELADSLAQWLKFDVAENVRPGYPNVLVVQSVVTGSRAKEFGLQKGDVLLCLDGHHLIFVSRLKFLMTVAYCLEKCASGAKSSGVLRFLVARKRVPQTTSSALDGIDSPHLPPSSCVLGSRSTRGETTMEDATEKEIAEGTADENENEKAKAKRKEAGAEEGRGYTRKKASGRGGAAPARAVSHQTTMGADLRLRAPSPTTPEIGPDEVAGLQDPLHDDEGLVQRTVCPRTLALVEKHFRRSLLYRVVDPRSAAAQRAEPELGVAEHQERGRQGDQGGESGSGLAGRAEAARERVGRSVVAEAHDDPATTSAAAN